MNIDQLIACAERELSLRRRVYPGQVAGKKITQIKADYEIETMKQIVETLYKLQAKELLL